jgi:hypothetical protein
MISPQEQAIEGSNPIQLEGVVDVYTISSLVIESVSPMMVEEQLSTTEEMDVDRQGET